jgi:hypothetical protein
MRFGLSTPTASAWILESFLPLNNNNYNHYAANTVAIPPQAASAIWKAESPAVLKNRGF